MNRRFAIVPALLLMVLAAASINQPSFHVYQSAFVHNRTATATPVRVTFVAPPPPIVRDLDAIRKIDTLHALVVSNSTSYFLYRGEPMGFELDLLKQFAKEDSLVLKVHIVRDMSALAERLNRGEGDIVAARLVPTRVDNRFMRFTRPLYRSRPVLVQRSEHAEALGGDAPADVDSMVANSGGAQREEAGDARREVERGKVRRPSDLVGDTVHLQKPSAYYQNLTELADSVSGDIEVVQVPATAPEGLMARIAEGKINYTVTEENVADLSVTLRDNLALGPVMGPPRSIVWAVRQNAPQLQARLDAWLETAQAKSAYQSLYRKYFVDRKGYGQRVASRYLTSETHVLSDYDALFREFARDLGWDWRLLASQSFQESRFDPQARSWAGAQGLLQLMPATAREQGVTNPTDPRDNVQGAVKFSKWLYTFWRTRLDAPPQRARQVHPRLLQRRPRPCAGRPPPGRQARRRPEPLGRRGLLAAPEVQARGLLRSRRQVRLLPRPGARHLRRHHPRPLRPLPAVRGPVRRRVFVRRSSFVVRGVPAFWFASRRPWGLLTKNDEPRATNPRYDPSSRSAPYGSGGGIGALARGIRAGASSSRSASWRSSAPTETRISMTESASDTMSSTRLSPKTSAPACCRPKKSTSMHSTHRKKLAAPSVCMLRMR